MSGGGTLNRISKAQTLFLDQGTVRSSAQLTSDWPASIAHRAEVGQVGIRTTRGCVHRWVCAQVGVCTGGCVHRWACAQVSVCPQTTHVNGFCRFMLWHLLWGKKGRHQLFRIENMPEEWPCRSSSKKHMETSSTVHTTGTIYQIQEIAEC